MTAVKFWVQSPSKRLQSFQVAEEKSIKTEEAFFLGKETSKCSMDSPASFWRDKNLLPEFLKEFFAGARSCLGSFFSYASWASWAWLGSSGGHKKCLMAHLGVFPLNNFCGQVCCLKLRLFQSVEKNYLVGNCNLISGRTLFLLAILFIKHPTLINFSVFSWEPAWPLPFCSLGLPDSEIKISLNCTHIWEGGCT